MSGREDPIGVSKQINTFNSSTKLISSSFSLGGDIKGSPTVVPETYGAVSSAVRAIVGFNCSVLAGEELSPGIESSVVTVTTDDVHDFSELTDTSLVVGHLVAVLTVEGVVKSDDEILVVTDVEILGVDLEHVPNDFQDAISGVSVVEEISKGLLVVISTLSRFANMKEVAVHVETVAVLDFVFEGDLDERVGFLVVDHLGAGGVLVILHLISDVIEATYVLTNLNSALERINGVLLNDERTRAEDLVVELIHAEILSTITDLALGVRTVDAGGDLIVRDLMEEGVDFGAGDVMSERVVVLVALKNDLINLFVEESPGVVVLLETTPGKELTLHCVVKRLGQRGGVAAIELAVKGLLIIANVDEGLERLKLHSFEHGGKELTDVHDVMEYTFLSVHETMFQENTNTIASHGAPSRDAVGFDKTHNTEVRHHVWDESRKFPSRPM